LTQEKGPHRRRGPPFRCSPKVVTKGKKKRGAPSKIGANARGYNSDGGGGGGVRRKKTKKVKR